MKKTSILEYNNHHYKITLEINRTDEDQNINEGRLVNKVKYKSIKVKTPIRKTKNIKTQDEVNHPNIIKSNHSKSE